MSTQKTKKAPRTCNCLKKVDEALKDRNAALERHPMMNFSTSKMTMSPPSVKLRKLDSKKRESLPSLFCTYCPFCGKKYE